LEIDGVSKTSMSERACACGCMQWLIRYVLLDNTTYRARLVQVEALKLIVMNKRILAIVERIQPFISDNISQTLCSTIVERIQLPEFVQPEVCHIPPPHFLLSSLIFLDYV
jgi:hypothetical protein